ncbi:MAG: SAM-dependent chlorinase/fluorinase [Bacteroidales bacterium]|jgi:S-adenosylmethionine hydrolase|nr:SAM-dependent chlorinase/fluorinase [Bacteroidales bacterium]
MSIITLTTDWNKNDYYIGAVKGAIYSSCNNVSVVDISHQVKPFNIFQAAFILKNCYANFPEGTVHLIGVKSDFSENHKHMIVRYNGHYFISTNNGIFSLLFDESAIEIYVIETPQPNSFPELTVFVPAASKILNGESPESVGTKTDIKVRPVQLEATKEESVIIGSVLYIDSYQNVITNITIDLFKEVGKGRPFKIYVQSNRNVISKINQTYQEASPGELLALFNSINLLEIAINGGNAAELLGLDLNSTVRINFK